MSELKTKIYTSGDHLPEGLNKDNFFHSPQLFALAETTPRQKPYLITLETEGGDVRAQMLALVRFRSSWLPPYLYRHCRIMGEGVYASPEEKEQLFGIMLNTLAKKLGPKVFYMEVSHLSQKMLGYKLFRENRFFPVRWMSIHNSLHSHAPEERLSERKMKRINQAYERGIVTDEVQSEADFTAFMRLLRQHNWLKPKRYVPHESFFKSIKEKGGGRLFVTRYRDHIIGCSVCVYSNGQSYLWYAAYRRKTYAFLHPNELTIWHAIKDAHSRGYEHIYFMDVGLPFRKNAFREFILRFGGKPVSTYRWFRFRWKWLNKLLSWLYRD